MAASTFGAMTLILNLMIQISFQLLIRELAAPTFDQDWSWYRRCLCMLCCTEHSQLCLCAAYKYMDPITEKSLAARICSGDESVA